MPKLNIAEEFKLQTRDRFTTVDCTLAIEVAGSELPNMGIVGEALEKAVTQIQNSITESYAKVPERV